MTDAEERDGVGPTRQIRPESGKRASGESSIYRDEDGRWHGFVSMGLKENGRRDRRHVSGARRADVVAKVRAIEAKRDAGLVDAAGRAPTVGEWLDHWLDNIAARRVRARTLESYRSTVRLHLRPGVGHHRLDRLQPEHLERLYGALADKGLSPASILRAHRVLSRALRVALQRGKSRATSPPWSIRRRPSGRRRRCRSANRKPGKCWLPPGRTVTPRGGRWRWQSACVSQKPSACDGRMSTWPTEH
jgi:integrase